MRCHTHLHSAVVDEVCLRMLGGLKIPFNDYRSDSLESDGNTVISSYV